MFTVETVPFATQLASVGDIDRRSDVIEVKD
jgi:hypothetical protein